MIIDMLEAVSEMLGLSLIEKREANDPNVICAKLMLDKIIQGMKKDGFSIRSAKEDPEVKLNPPNKIKTPKEDQYAIVLNDDRTIREIQGYPLDGKIKLDGVIMSHLDAIGKTFQQGELV